MPLRTDDTYLPQLLRYKKAGVSIIHINVGAANIGLEQQFRIASFMHWWLQRRPDKYALVEQVEDIPRAIDQGKLAVAFNIEGASAIGTQLSLVSSFYDLGVRWMSLAYNRANNVGGGCHGNDPGLSDFGRDLLDEMARVGMIACCSHTGYRTSMDAFEHNDTPVILSHSNARALTDHPRNIPDELIKACAKNGGVIGINGVGLFLGGNDRMVERLIHHVDHMVQLVGPEHVGLGLDFCFDGLDLDEILDEFADSFPDGHGYAPGIRFIEPERMPEITAGLVRLGYPENAILGILGENFYRIAKRVWKSPSTQAQRGPETKSWRERPIPTKHA
ncbi:MAG TPA: membrane dipeptidase [Myxococcales bacterium]|nr:membrane dipeptidase [Myxococcales bacterium]